MMDTREVFLKHVCPGLGCGIALLLFCSPLPAVWRCNQSKSLGDLNALPFVCMSINCAAWIFYALLLTDYYIYFGNIPGMALGMYYVLVCYKFSKEAAQDILRNLVVAGMVLFWGIGLVSMAAALSPAATKTLWGATCVTVLGIYYVAPLSSVAKLVAERDSSSLHWPLCSMNVVNGMLWFAYGLALKDWFVCFPNGIGAGFNVICLVMCFIFPARRRKQQQQQQQTTTPPGQQVLDQINPAANWGALRLQSFAQGGPGGGGGSGQGLGEGEAGGGGFFDLTQLRWRTGRLAGSFRNSSFVRLLSGRSSLGASQRGSGCAPELPAGGGLGGGGTGVAVGSAGDVGVKVPQAGGLLDQGLPGGKGVGSGDVGPFGAVIKAEKGAVGGAGGGDVEQANVVADSTCSGAGAAAAAAAAGVSPRQP